MDVTAHLRYLHMSPRKVRRVARLVSGMPVLRADAELGVRRERAAEPLRKLLRSALANARQRTNAKPEDMVLVSMRVDSGPAMKRFRPRSRGMAHPLRRRTSHVSVTIRVPAAARKAQVPAAEPPATPDAPSASVAGEESKVGRTGRKVSLREAHASRRESTRTPRLPKIGRRFFQRKSV